MTDLRNKMKPCLVFFLTLLVQASVCLAGFIPSITLTQVQEFDFSADGEIRGVTVLPLTPTMVFMINDQGNCSATGTNSFLMGTIPLEMTIHSIYPDNYYIEEANSCKIYFYGSKYNDDGAYIVTIGSFVIDTNTDGLFVPGSINVLQTLFPTSTNLNGSLLIDPTSKYIFYTMDHHMVRMQIKNCYDGTSICIPIDNPFGNEIYSKGLHDAKFCSFDPVITRVLCLDTGIADYDSYITLYPGSNYGWPNYEGQSCIDPNNCAHQDYFEVPNVIIPHDGDACCGYIYRGSVTGRFLVNRFVGLVNNKLIYSDHIRRNGGSGTKEIYLSNDDLTKQKVKLFGDGFGDIYLLSRDVGTSHYTIYSLYSRD